MIRSRGFGASSVGSALLCALGVAQAADRLALPAPLAKYGEWTQLLKSPYEVPMELWTRCMAPSPEDWREAQKRYGPHTRRFIRVYGNAAAIEAVSKESGVTFRPGSIIVKEKLAGSPHSAPVGVAFMIKHESPAFADTGGWEFSYFPAATDARKTHADCASCHRAAPSGDYLFGKYPR